MTVIVLSFVAGLLLMLVPLPDWAGMYRPDWVVLILLYWCLDIPHRVGTGVGWVVGLVTDVTQAQLMGVNALAMALVGYLANRFHLRLRMFPWWQQALSVLILLLIYRAVVGWIRGFVTPLHFGYDYWTPCLVGMVVWPWLFVILRDASRKAKIH